MGSSNTFSKALKHLKASRPSSLHEEVPTNNTQNLYRVEPMTFQETHPGVDAPDFDQDGDGSSGYTGTDTSGLFMPDGTIRVAEPPGDTSAILGPMASMWYAWGNFSTFGYIRQSDRKMVNLGRITGKLSDWDGVSNFTSYNNDFTIDQAVWFRDVEKYGGISNDPAEANYRAFYPGPPSNTPDQYGRYYCTTTGRPKNRRTGTNPPNRGPEGSGFPWGSGSNPNRRRRGGQGGRPGGSSGNRGGYGGGNFPGSGGPGGQGGEGGPPKPPKEPPIDPDTGKPTKQPTPAELNAAAKYVEYLAQKSVNDPGSLTPTERERFQAYSGENSVFKPTVDAVLNRANLTPAQAGKIATNMAGGTPFNPSLQAYGGSSKGLGGEIKLGQHGTGQQAAQGIKKDGFRAGSRQNVYGTKGVFIDPSASGAAADDFARAGAAAEAGGRGTAGRTAAQRAADLKAAGQGAGKGTKIPVAYKPGTGSRMNIPGTKYAEVGVDASKATKGARLAQNAITKYPNSAKAQQLITKGATTTASKGAARTVAKTLGKAVPFAGAAISVADAADRISKGDVAGAVLSGLTAVPGPVGWTALATQIVTDSTGLTGGGSRPTSVKEENEYSSYQEYVDKAKEVIDRDKVNLGKDEDLLNVLKSELGLHDKLSDKDKEYLVDLFDNSKDVNPEEVSSFLNKIIKKLSSGEKKVPKSSLPRLPKRTNKDSSVNESHTLDVVKNIKKPVVIEEKKEKVKRRPRVIGSEPRTLNTSLMKQAEVPASFKKPEERMWGKYEREQNARASQDRKNVVLDHLGNADQAWEYLLDRNAGKRSFAGYFEKDGTPRTIFTDGKVKTVTREEKIGTDTLIFFTDEEGKKGSILQSEYNELQDQAHTQQMFAEYEATVSSAKEEENDFDKIANKLELKAERNPTNDKIQSMLSSYRALSHLRKEDKKQEAHFTSWKSTIDGKITSNFQSWVDSVGQETADAVAVTEAMTSGDMFVRTQLEPTGEEIRVPVPSDSFRYNQSDAVTTTGGVVKFGEVAPHNYDSQYWWRQTASTNYITTTDVPGEQTVTHVTFDVDLGTGIDAPLPNHPLKVEYSMVYRDSNGNAYNAGTGTLGNITAGGKTSFELPKYHEYFEISFDLTVDGTWMRSYELDYQRRMFVGTTLAGATLTQADAEGNIGPIAMILDVLRHPGPFDDDADDTMHVLLFNGFSSRISGLPGGSGGGLGSDREYLYNLIRSQYAHLKDRYALTYTINSMGLTRVAPITVWVPLDSPEAVSFMRTAPEMQGLTPAQRLKKLKEMLEAGNEYLIKMLGYQGSTATPDGYNTEVALDTIPYEEPSPGPGGYKPPGSYDPNKFYDLKTDPSQLPSPNLPSTGPGRSSVPDGTEVAASYPKMDPLDKLLKDIDDADKKLKNQPPGTRPGKGRGMGDRWDFNKFVKGKNNTVVAHHEPKGKYLADSKTFKKKSFSNWYSSMESEISDKVVEDTKKLIEGMTSGSLFQANLPAMGDVPLDTVSDTSISDSDLLQPYQDYGDPDYAISAQIQTLGTVDASEYDTLKLTIGGSFNSRVVDGSSLDDKISIGVLVGGTYAGNYLAHDLDAGTHIISIPSRFQKANVKFDALTITAIQGVTGSRSITNIEFQRRNSKTIFVSLDSPEAVNFIRTDPMMKGLTPQQQLDKLKEMLEAGNEYLLQQLGYIGSTATPGPDEVAQALPYTDEDDAFDNPYYDDPFKDPGDLDDSDDESTWDFASTDSDTEIAQAEPLSMNTPGGVQGTAKDYTYDPHMKTWVPNISDVEKRAAGRRSKFRMESVEKLNTHTKEIEQ